MTDKIMTLINDDDRVRILLDVETIDVSHIGDIIYSFALYGEDVTGFAYAHLVTFLTDFIKGNMGGCEYELEFFLNDRIPNAKIKLDKAMGRAKITIAKNRY